MVPASARGGGALGRGLVDGGSGGKGGGLPAGSGGRNGGRAGGARAGVRGALFDELVGGTTTTDCGLGLLGQLGKRDVPDALEVEGVADAGGVDGVANE